MSGKMKTELPEWSEWFPKCHCLRSFFDQQLENQMTLLKKGAYDGFASGEIAHLPADDPKLCSFHIQQLISEIGEVLDADKRWKNFRNTKYDPESKLDEIADCFIVLMNIAMYSGFSADVLCQAIQRKIDVVSERIKEV